MLAAEERLVAAAGRHDGYAVTVDSVDMALLESTANGITLNAGQATLVREMATSGARLQAAIAPAGSGKTTAMRALASAWADGGGTIIGLAPSAAAADALRSQIDTQTDTLAKPDPLARPSTRGPRDRRQQLSGDARVGRRHRLLHPRGHRRGRHGRHPLAGRRGLLHP
ncbi:AAA family ATPase [Nocardioides convexus]|uniref:AAA family ATPase n=1 Tax=Nocardioides convexus TaxID=2712224 RepID=UPI0024185CEE|nr:AAA family ATPase [Nocardioides convexus]